ncbi:ABC transporter substrate-binding protein [Paenibacillus sp. N3.4]|nr:ABC transporter substrate-binding protein [Paenibacillus sp. N3.4]
MISILLAGVVAGCGNGAAVSKTQPSSAPAAVTNVPSAAAAGTPAAAKVDVSKVTLRIGQTGWGNLDAGFKAAQLADTPYKIEFSVFQGGNLQLEAMSANHLDVALTSEIPPIFASQSANGGNFKVIAVQESTTLKQELVIPKGSPIKSVKDLKGKQVAYVSSTTAHYFLLKMLEQNGLAWSDIKPVQLSTADGLGALIGGKVDALASYGNAIISAHQNGATELASAKDILSGNFLIEATPDAIQDPGKHAAIADFLLRLNKFYDWTRANQNKWAEITAQNTNQPVEQALATLKDGEAQRSSKIVPTSDKAIASEQDVADALQVTGSLKEKINVSASWSHAFDDELKKAAK